jgi:hypothetical protein
LTQYGDIRPVPLPNFWAHLEAALDFDPIANALNLSPPQLTSESGFSTLLDWLRESVGASSSSSIFDVDCDFQAPIQENHLYQLAITNRNNPNIMVAGMMIMLALIYLRFSNPDSWQQPEWEISRMGHNGRLPVHQLIQQLRRRLRSGPVTIGEITQWLYSDYVILQHQAIAAHKLPDNTFRFRREGNRLRFFNLQNTLRFMDSRFDALSTVVYELGLCGNLANPDHALTADGERFLLEGDLL